MAQPQRQLKIHQHCQVAQPSLYWKEANNYAFPHA